MPPLYLVRHGQDEDNAHGILNGHRDLPLTRVGVEQAHQLARRLQSISPPIEAIYSSQLQRAWKTAEILAEYFNLPSPQVLRALIERDFGVMTGRKISEIEPLCRPHVLKTEQALYFLKAEGAESFPQLFQRAQGVLRQLEEKHLQGNIMFVTHGDIGKMIYAAYYELPWPSVLQEVVFSNAECITLH